MDTLDYTTPPAVTTGPESPPDTTAATEPPEVPEPTLTVTEEVDWEHNAVKITVSGDGRYYFPNLRGELIENYRYEIGVNSSGRIQDFPLPMESPVVAYYPISSYIRETSPIEICKVDANGNTYREEYAFSLDIASMLSDEPLELQDEFLHAAMTDFSAANIRSGIFCLSASFSSSITAWHFSRMTENRIRLWFRRNAPIPPPLITLRIF